jgi:hypothetical protein
MPDDPIMRELSVVERKLETLVKSIGQLERAGAVAEEAHSGKVWGWEELVDVPKATPGLGMDITANNVRVVMSDDSGSDRDDMQMYESDDSDVLDRGKLKDFSSAAIEKAQRKGRSRRATKKLALNLEKLDRLPAPPSSRGAPHSARSTARSSQATARPHLS